jgi:hypothetical protein
VRRTTIAFSFGILALPLLAACADSAPPPTTAASVEAPAQAEVDCEQVPESLTRAVSVVVNLEALRGHPLGQKLAPMVLAAPEWKDLVQSVLKDPLNDIDWVYLSGPSRTDSSKDVVFVHHNLDDAAIDRGMAGLPAKLHGRTAPFDLDAPGAKGTLLQIDQEARVIIRAQPHLLAVVPPDLAKSIARTLTRSKLRAPTVTGQALRAWVHSPHTELPQAPEAIRDLRVSLVARSDGGADVAADADCKDVNSAHALAEMARANIAKYSGNVLVRVVSAGILDAVKVTDEGQTVHARVSASESQVSRLLALLGSASRGSEEEPEPKPSK